MNELMPTACFPSWLELKAMINDIRRKTLFMRQYFFEAPALGMSRIESVTAER